MSYHWGKDKVREYLIDNLPMGSKILDIGAGPGIYADYLNDYFVIDAIDIKRSNYYEFNYEERYRKSYIENLLYFDYSKEKYSAAIIGETLKYIPAETSQIFLNKIKDVFDIIIVSIPYNARRTKSNPSTYDKNVQENFTNEIFLQRYPMFEPLYIGKRFGYYIKK